MATSSIVTPLFQAVGSDCVGGDDLRELAGALGHGGMALIGPDADDLAAGTA